MPIVSQKEIKYIERLRKSYAKHVELLKQAMNEIDSRGPEKRAALWCRFMTLHRCDPIPYYNIESALGISRFLRRRPPQLTPVWASAIHWLKFDMLEKRGILLECRQDRLLAVSETYQYVTWPKMQVRRIEKIAERIKYVVEAPLKATNPLPEDRPKGALKKLQVVQLAAADEFVSLLSRAATGFTRRSR